MTATLSYTLLLAVIYVGRKVYGLKHEELKRGMELKS